MELAPELPEPDVVLTATQCARPVPGRERRRLVQEEQLGELPRLHQRLPVPAAELEPARDPASSSPAPPDPSLLVVQAATISVDLAARGISNQLAARSDAVAARHPKGKNTTAVGDVRRPTGTIESWRSRPSTGRSSRLRSRRERSSAPSWSPP